MHLTHQSATTILERNIIQALVNGYLMMRDMLLGRNNLILSCGSMAYVGDAPKLI